MITGLFLERESTIRLVVVVAIIIIGLILTKLLYSFFVSAYRRSVKKRGDLIDVNKEIFIKRLVMYTVLLITLLTSLIYLRVSVIDNLFFSIYDSLPNVFAIVLAVIFGILIVELIVFIIRTFSKTSGLLGIIEDYGKGEVYNIVIFMIRVFLYVIMFVTVLDLFKIKAGLLKSLISLILYAIIAIIALLLFFSLKDFANDLVSGYYLKTSKMFRPGKRIKVGNVKGEIQNIKSLSTEIKTDSGYIMHLTNKTLLRNPVLFERTKSDIEKLEDIRSYFVAQNKSYCGPASLSMALAIFGYDFDQNKIGRMAKTRVSVGTHPNALIRTVHTLTDRKVRGVWIPADKITNLKDELKRWLAEGALIIPDFKKSFVFPTALTAHYSLCLGVKGDELLILDPSSVAGGVYLVNYNKIYKGMDTHSDLIKGKRGYLVLAPKGTAAYWRIVHGYVYSDSSLYHELSKKIRITLQKLEEKTKFRESVFPKSVSNFLNNMDKGDKVARLWKPKKRLPSQ